MPLDIPRQEENGRLLLRLRGRLDIETSPKLEAALAASGALHVSVDFGECDYVSSAGLRVLLSANKRQAAIGGSLTLRNVPPNVQAVLEATGAAEIFDWSPKSREISLAGCELISKGGFGDCYRLDRETVVKLYREGVDPSVAEKERRFAKAAFVLGVPTALSYEVVTCGARTGIVYEMLEAELFSAVIRDNPDDMRKHAGLLSHIAKTIHAMRGDRKIFPDIKEKFRTYIRQMRFFLDEDDIDLLLGKLERIPPADTCVHFDIHSSNIMLKDGEPYIIDMGDFSIGSPFFDIGLLTAIYATPEFDVCELATGISQEKGQELFDLVIEDYFNDRPKEDLAFFTSNRHFLASLRAIYTITALPSLREKLSRALKEGLLPKIRLEG